MYTVSDEQLDEFIAILAKQGTTFTNRDEARKCAEDMIEFYCILAEGLEGEAKTNP